MNWRRASVVVITMIAGALVPGPAFGATSSETAPSDLGAITIGTVVAGSITAAGVSNDYTLQVGEPGTSIVPEGLNDGCACGWGLTGPDGLAFAGQLNGAEAVTWLVPGSYVLELSGEGGVGTYSFELNAVPAPETFAITTDSTVSPGSPSVGAGDIESPGAEDVYDFSIPSGGQDVQLVSLADGCSCSWSLRSVKGSYEYGFASRPVSNTSTMWLPEGIYALTVSAPPLDTGTYSFELAAVLLSTQGFAIAIGDTVAPGSPAAGAGDISTPGAIQSYSFGVSGDGELLSLTALTGSCDCTWAVRSTGGSYEYGFTPIPMQGSQQVFLPSGFYEVIVAGVGEGGGTYSFQVSAVPVAQDFSIAIGDTVSPGSPAAGAGVIQARGAEQAYAFDVPGGGIRLELEDLSGTCTCSWCRRRLNTDHLSTLEY